MTENKKYDVVALGELLIDFTDNGISAQGNPVLEANPGGAPCNVLSMLSNFGYHTAFLGKVGNDGFGHMLENTIREQGIDTVGLVKDDAVHTTLALVLKKENGDRDFAFYRNPGADMNISVDELNEECIRNAKIFHFGSLSLTDEPVRSTTKRALEVAHEAGCLISFDPNLREPLWNSLDEAHDQIAWGMAQADFLKISDNEIVWFTGKEDYDEGIQILQNQYPNLKLICLSMGPDGSRAYTKNAHVEYPAFLQEGTIETTGAGDTFCACMLAYLLEHGIEECDDNELKKALCRANAAASIVTTKKGALRVMPSVDEVYTFINAFEK